MTVGASLGMMRITQLDDHSMLVTHTKEYLHLFLRRSDAALERAEKAPGKVET
jgi:hypothetical protein